MKLVLQYKSGELESLYVFVGGGHEGESKIYKTNKIKRDPVLYRPNENNRRVFVASL